MIDNMKVIRNKPYVVTIVALLCLAAVSCNNSETYAEKKERENSQIRNFISERNIDVIVLDDFLKDTITNNPETGPDKSRNEYVLFPESGVYVQIVRRGTGKELQDGDSKVYDCRLLEYNIATKDTVYMSLHIDDHDELYCSRKGAYYTATVRSGYMKNYGQSVPNGWLVAFPFIKPSFLNGAASAKIKVIVPHDKGTTTAMNSVVPYYYELIISSQKYGND